MALVGWALMRPERVSEMGVAASCFADPRWRVAWETIGALAAAGDGAIDAITVAYWIARQKGSTETLSIQTALAEAEIHACVAPERYVDIVRDGARRRELLLAARRIQRAAEGGATVEELERFVGEMVPGGTAQQSTQWLNRRGIVELIRARASEAWVSIGLGMSIIAEVRAGGLVTLQGPTGAGKTSLADGIAARFAREQGWVVILSLELSIDEMGGRMIGMAVDSSWGQVLRGELSDDRMLEALPERLEMIEWDGATMEMLDTKLAELRALDPEGPMMFVVDYGQLLESATEEVRQRVAGNWERAKRVAARYRAVGFMLSQMSRGASKAARGGERLGADAVDGGAESAAIERWSSLVMEIGAAGPEDQYGRHEVSLSIAKDRMGGGDRVIPMSYEGRTGRWAVIGDSRPASEVKAQAKAENADRNVQTAALAIRQVAELATEPKTREELLAGAGVGPKSGRPAITVLLRDGVLVEVKRRKPRSHTWKLWTPQKAEAAGLPIVGTGVDE
jgi:replicative DNA helicase